MHPIRGGTADGRDCPIGWGDIRAERLLAIAFWRPSARWKLPVRRDRHRSYRSNRGYLVCPELSLGTGPPNDADMTPPIFDMPVAKIRLRSIHSLSTTVLSSFSMKSTSLNPFREVAHVLHGHALGVATTKPLASPSSLMREALSWSAPMLALPCRFITIAEGGLCGCSCCLGTCTLNVRPMVCPSNQPG